MTIPTHPGGRTGRPTSKRKIGRAEAFALRANRSDQPAQSTRKRTCFRAMRQPGCKPGPGLSCVCPDCIRSEVGNRKRNDGFGSPPGESYSPAGPSPAPCGSAAIGVWPSRTRKVEARVAVGSCRQARANWRSAGRSRSLLRRALDRKSVV